MSIQLQAKSQEQNEFKPHPCLESNLRWAAKWLKANESDIPEGMRVMITAGHEMKKQFLTFMQRPAKEAYGCGFANHIDLNQPELLVYETVQKTFSFYKKLTKSDFYNSYINMALKV